MSGLMLSEEERLLKATVREFADEVLEPRAAEYDRSEEFPWDSIRGLARLGLYLEYAEERRPS